MCKSHSGGWFLSFNATSVTWFSGTRKCHLEFPTPVRRGVSGELSWGGVGGRPGLSPCPRSDLVLVITVSSVMPGRDSGQQPSLSQ